MEDLWHMKAKALGGILRRSLEWHAHDRQYPDSDRQEDFYRSTEHSQTAEMLSLDRFWVTPLTDVRSTIHELPIESKSEMILNKPSRLIIKRVATSHSLEAIQRRQDSCVRLAAI